MHIIKHTSLSLQQYQPFVMLYEDGNRPFFLRIILSILSNSCNFFLFSYHSLFCKRLNSSGKRGQGQVPAHGPGFLSENSPLPGMAHRLSTPLSQTCGNPAGICKGAPYWRPAQLISLQVFGALMTRHPSHRSLDNNISQLDVPVTCLSAKFLHSETLMLSALWPNFFHGRCPHYPVQGLI